MSAPRARAPSRARRATAPAAPSRRSPTRPLVLGYIDPEYFLGGRMRLDSEAAAGAVAKIASRLGLEREGRGARDNGSCGRPHGRRDQGHHDQPGDRSAREPAGRGRRGGRAEYPADRARTRMPPGAGAAHGRRAQRLRRSVLRHRERVHAKQVRLHRRFSLRSGQPRAGGNHRVDGASGGRAARARADALQARVFRRGALSVPGMGARRRVAQGRLRRARPTSTRLSKRSIASTSGFSRSRSRASRSNAFTGGAG